MYDSIALVHKNTFHFFQIFENVFNQTNLVFELVYNVYLIVWIWIL